MYSVFFTQICTFYITTIKQNKDIILASTTKTNVAKKVIILKFLRPSWNRNGDKSTQLINRYEINKHVNVLFEQRPLRKAILTRTHSPVCGAIVGRFGFISAITVTNKHSTNGRRFSTWSRWTGRFYCMRNIVKCSWSFWWLSSDKRFPCVITMFGNIVTI